MATKNAKIASRNVEQKGQKPYFTNYILAGTSCGETKAAILRLVYKQERQAIEQRRYINMILDRTGPNNQGLPRGGFPTKRERDPEAPSKRGMPNSNFLNCFKSVVTMAFQPPYIRTKMWVLHATRGWKTV